jgi:hypothetical protein
MLTARCAIALTVLAAFAPAGCVATHAPVVESNMGVALSSARSGQILNLGAATSADPVTGIGGVPASEAIGRYYDSFKAPPPTFIVINPGAASPQ